MKIFISAFVIALVLLCPTRGFAGQGVSVDSLIDDFKHSSFASADPSANRGGKDPILERYQDDIAMEKGAYFVGSSIIFRYFGETGSSARAKERAAFKASRFSEMLPYLFKDGQQTLDFKNHPGMHEMNQILGSHPSDDQINAYFLGGALLFHYIALILPEPWASSFVDSIRFTEELVVRQNNAVFNGTAPNVNTMPIGIVFTAQWDILGR